MSSALLVRRSLRAISRTLIAVLLANVLLPALVHASASAEGGRYVMMCTGQGLVAVWIETLRGA